MSARAAAAASVDSQGPISQLPCELLAHVLSYLPMQATEVRLVCRGFRDCAWGAFGARFEFTKFDIRSIASMKTLKAVSEDSNLAPFVKTLQLATGFLPDEFPGVQGVFNEDYDSEFEEDMDSMLFLEPDDYLDDHLLSRLHFFQHHVGYWFADAWKWTPCMAHDDESLEAYATNYQKQAVVDFLAKTFSSFPNLHAIEYEDRQIPESCRGLYEDIMDLMMDQGISYDAPESDIEIAINILGLDMILQALVTGKTPIKSLSFPVPAIYCHALATYTSPAILQKVFASVESLHLWNSFDGHYGHHLDAKQQYMLTSANAPKLRHLKWQNWRPNPGTTKRYTPSWLTSNPPDTSFPPLRRLDLTSNWTGNEDDISFDDTFFTFLRRVGPTLKILTLKIGWRLNWTELVEFLGASNEISLEKLEISPEQFFDLASFFKDREVPAKDVVYQAAQEVVLHPDAFKESFEMLWAPKSVGRPKGKGKKTKRRAK